jgi:hypothetical protein
MSNFPRETPQSFFKKTRFLQNGMVDQKKNPYKMPPFVTKIPLEWNMGQAISQWKYTKVYIYIG